MSFYNTTYETDPALASYRTMADKQNAMVMRVFNTITWPLSPSQVLSYFPAPQPPLTSIRRAISTLTKAGALVKTEAKRKGMFGRSEFCWCLPEANDPACQSPD